jgi:hypothetical protein
MSISGGTTRATDQLAALRRAFAGMGGDAADGSVVSACTFQFYQMRACRAGARIGR